MALPISTSTASRSRIVLMMGGADIANGLNRKENHAPIRAQLRKNIDFAADNGIVGAVDKAHPALPEDLPHLVPAR